MRALETLGCTLALASALAGNAAAQGEGGCGSSDCLPGRTLVVNTFDDQDDGACDPDHCSLREAIAAANEDALRDTVLFGLPWSYDNMYIETPLPVIWEPLVIDGTSQPGIDIDIVHPGDALRVYADDTEIRGLAIRLDWYASNGAAIRLSDGTGARIEGNVLRSGGILIEDATGLVVGGSEPGQGNRIVGAGIGIEILRLNRLPDGGDRIEGNEILGVDIGVLVHGSYFTLGGLEPGSANAIHGYSRAGVIVEGGFFPEDVSGRGIAILGNSMLSAGGIGIDLGFDGPTPNDAWDADTGSNEFQNSPVLASAEAGDGVVAVSGTLHSTPLSEFRIELFASSYPDSAERLLGALTETTDLEGNLAFELTQPAGDLTGLVVVSATATSLATRETSELSDIVFIEPRDRDGDGVPNASDLCPDAFDPEQLDADGDGVGDACDPADDDADRDLVRNELDNCPALANPDQADSDGDGAGDACDADDDGDGLSDAYESATSCLSASFPDAGDDPDNDGLGSAEEFGLGTNPCTSDSDEDYLPDGVEVFGLGPFGTDPLDPDSDDDGALDGDDNCPRLFYEETGESGSNPDQSDLDRDGRGDVCDPDDDGDGLSDADELAAGTNPRASDSDADGHLDPTDACPVVAPEGGDADADGCTDTLEGLIAIVESLGLPAGLERALLAKLEDAAQALARGKESVAIRRLADFVSLVEAKRGGSIGDAEANLLVTYATGLIAQLEADGA